MSSPQRATTKPARAQHPGGLPRASRAFDQRAAFDERLRAHWTLELKHLVQRVIRIVLAGVGLLSSLGTGRLRPLRPHDPGIRRVLVIRVDLIGDVVLSLPAIQALRAAYPTATIDMLVLPSAAGVLETADGIDRVLVYDPNIWRTPRALLDLRNWRTVGHLLATLRTAGYDLCVSVAGDWASVLAWLSGARRRIGYSGEAYPGLLTDPVPGRRYARREHELTYVHRLAQAAGGCLTLETALPRLRPSVEARQDAVAAVAARLHPHDHIAHGPLVVLHAGAQNGSAKRWPLAHWAVLADLLVRRHDARVVFTGAAGDRPLIDGIAVLAHEPYADLCGQTTLAQLVALAAAADLVISGDSGPLHIAGAVGTPVIGLYGPTDPALSGPVGPDAIVLRHPVWCAPCYDASATAECRFGNPICMKQLSAAAVFAAASQRLRALAHFEERDGDRDLSAPSSTAGR